MDSLLSPKQIAGAIGASESSVKRWCDQGLLTTIKTAGGHRRISVQEALRFVREQNQSIVEPRILAMPSTIDRRARRIEGCVDRLTDALITDNEVACHTIVLELFVTGYSVSQIFDDVIAVAFHRIGEKWACQELDVYRERSSCQIAVRLLHELRLKQVEPTSGVLAIGATIAGDQYSLPVTMAEIVLRSVGWDARLLGTSIPINSIIAAIRDLQPALFWLSVSHIDDEAAFVSGFNELVSVAASHGTSVILGGRALTQSLRSNLRFSLFCETMWHLEDCGRSVLAQRRAAMASPNLQSSTGSSAG